MICTNCLSSSLKVLNSIASPKTNAVTSDAQLMRGFTAKRTLCRQCACIEIHYSPKDRLKRYFKEDYDISDPVQNNLIVVKNRALGKHTYIYDKLFPRLQGLPESGRFLEIACGGGQLTNLFHEIYPRWECFGIDPSLKAPVGKFGKVTFIQDYFNEEYFKGMTFDLIVAHGFLNRSPVLPELLRIRGLSKKGTLLSLELLVLENSVFAPYIWDHPFMYKTEVFESYLRHAGFGIVSKTSCVSSYHYLCRCTGKPSPLEKLFVDSAMVKGTSELFACHIEWWNKVKENFRRQSKSSGKRYGLYGAGLYSSVLLSLLGKNRLNFVVDEVKAGTVFFGIPVIGLKEASGIEDCHVLICARHDYLGHMEKKLNEFNIEYSVLNP